ncbi:NeuA CMP-N-acetylneuraminic acid synthetase [Candidatus Pelagibacterales bacterium]
MKKKILALVLARKGSIRLKNKNNLKLHNKPLIQWTFDKLNKKEIRKLFTNVLVSTDSLKIKNISNQYKFLSPWLRPKKLCTKSSTSESAALHALNWYENNIEKIDGLFLFQPTSPFRDYKKIISAIKIFLKTNKQVVSVCSKKLNKFNKNSINGSMYLTPINILKKHKTFSERGFVPLKMTSEFENIDIDTQEDFDRAKKLLKNINN